MGDAESSLSLGQNVVTRARGKLDQQVPPNGECYDLADAALVEAKAKSAGDYGKISRDANYVWGKRIAPKDALPGDILQLRDYKVFEHGKTVVVTKRPGVSTSTEEQVSTTSTARPHHTAIVESNDGNGQFTILEQNYQPPGATEPIKYVMRSVIAWKSYSLPPKKKLTIGRGGASVETTTTVTYKVKGTMWVYRPQAR